MSDLLHGNDKFMGVAPGSRHTEWRCRRIGHLASFSAIVSDAVHIALIAVIIRAGAKDPIYEVVDQVLDKMPHYGVRHGHHDQSGHQEVQHCLGQRDGLLGGRLVVLVELLILRLGVRVLEEVVQAGGVHGGLAAGDDTGGLGVLQHAHHAAGGDLHRVDALVY